MKKQLRFGFKGISGLKTQGLLVQAGIDPGGLYTAREVGICRRNSALTRKVFLDGPIYIDGKIRLFQ